MATTVQRALRATACCCQSVPRRAFTTARPRLNEGLASLEAVDPPAFQAFANLPKINSHPTGPLNPDPDVQPTLDAVPPHPDWVMDRRPEYWDPPRLPRTHGVHVATLTISCYNPDREQMVLATGFALQAAYHLGIPCGGPSAPPITRELVTVLRSGFVHKSAQENFWRLTHTRVIKAYDANEEVINRWINFLTHNVIAANTRWKAQRIVARPIGWGKDLDKTAAQERAILKKEKEAEDQRKQMQVWGSRWAATVPGKSKKEPSSLTSPAGQAASELVASFQDSGLSPEEQIKRLAAELIKTELQPKVDAAEAKEAGTTKVESLGASQGGKEASGDGQSFEKLDR